MIGRREREVERTARIGVVTERGGADRGSKAFYRAAPVPFSRGSPGGPPGAGSGARRRYLTCPVGGAHAAGDLG